MKQVQLPLRGSSSAFVEWDGRLCCQGSVGQGVNTMPGVQKVLPLILLPVRPPSASQVPHLTNGNDNDLQAENAMRIKAMPQAFDEHCSATEL